MIQFTMNISFVFRAGFLFSLGHITDVIGEYLLKDEMNNNRVTIEKLVPEKKRRILLIYPKSANCSDAFLPHVLI